MHSSSSTAVRFSIISVVFVALAVIMPSMHVAGMTAHAQVPQPTCTLTASPNSVAYNGSTTLSWYTTDATSRTITDIGFVMTSGVQPIYNITTSKTYVMTVSGPGGTSTCQTTITVGTQTSQAPTCSAYASSTQVPYGGSTTVSWTGYNATTAYLSDYGSVPVSGSQVVGPIYGTRTYTVNVSNAFGSNSCQVTVYSQTQTQNPPTCSLDVSQSSVTSGQGVSLSWSTANATSVSITNLGSVNVSGSQVVYPYTTTTYVLTAYGNGGSTSCTRTVYIQSNSVINTPSCSLYANPTVTSYGGSATLVWNTSNAYSVSIDNGVGSVQANGSYVLSNITGTRTYTLTAYGNGGTRTCQTTVTANGNQGGGSGGGGYAPAASCGMAVTRDDMGGYTLAWYTQNALFSSITGIGNVGPTGTYAITPAQTTTYTMTVRGYDGVSRTCQTTAVVSGYGGGNTGGGFGGVTYGGGTGGSGGGVPLSRVPYTGAADYFYPLFIAAFAVTSFYAAVQMQKKIRFA
jgi:hypothetical protein